MTKYHFKEKIFQNKEWKIKSGETGKEVTKQEQKIM